MTLERAYVDEEHGQAICCWSAPDRASIEGLFAKAKVTTESIRKVEEHLPSR
ncbi:MAG TPA: hypothetical protein VF399_12385 [bacterium]